MFKIGLLTNVLNSTKLKLNTFNKNKVLEYTITFLLVLNLIKIKTVRINQILSDELFRKNTIFQKILFKLIMFMFKLV